MLNWGNFVSQLFNGLVSGALLALISAGLTIVYGTLGVLNLAHGALFMLGGYAGYVAFQATGNFFIAVVVGTLFVGIVGVVIERLIVRFFYARPEEDQILVTFGIGIVVVELVRTGFGSLSQTVQAPVLVSPIVNLGFAIYPEYRLIAFAIVAVALAGLYVLLYRTRLGMVVRAGIEDAGMVDLLGINIQRTFMLVFGIGAMAAGFAGIINAPIISITPNVGDDILIECFVVVVIGGVGSFPGAIVGGIIAGEIMSLTSMFNPQLSQVALYAVMALVLITRPQGLFGHGEARVTTPRPRRFGYWPELALAIVLIVSPFVLPAIGGTSDTLSRILIWGLFGLGFDLIFGFTGLLSFGQAAFYGSGGFIASYLLVSHTIPNVFLALLIGTVGAALIAGVIGLLALRRSGIYFAMITVAFGEMFFFLENSLLYPWTGGENGLPNVPKPSISVPGFAFEFRDPWAMYGLLAVIFFIGFAIARRIIASPFGHVLTAIRDNPTRAKAVGHNILLYKLTVFIIAGAYAGLAGGLEGSLQGYMSPEAFTFETSGQLVMQTVIGGAGTLLGPLVGGALWLYARNELQGALHLGAAWKLVLGAIFVILIMFLRHGIVGGVTDLWNHFFPRRAPETEAKVPAAPVGEPNAPILRRPITDRIAIETKGLGKRYGGIVANEDIDFRVNEGEIRGLIGPNGAGKSTFFKMLTGEVPPSSGHIYMFGEETTGLDVTAVCQKGIAKSYQINQLFSKLTVRRNLMISALSRTRGEFRADLLRNTDHMDELNADIEETMRLLDLTARADVPVSALAYGEKRRIEIGLALGTNPKILLLDEPLAGMSPTERTDTVKLLKHLALGRTLVVVEHDMDALFNMADRVTVLAQGKILTEGTPAEVQNSAAVQDAYLGGIHA